MTKTKDKILAVTITLFNQDGYSNVSMQRLADYMGLSPGNLTYHFRKKEDLMLALYDLFREEMSEVIPPFSVASNTLDLLKIDLQIKKFYALQKRFLFFYLDLLDIERAYPVIAEQHYEHIDHQIKALQQGLSYNIVSGYMQELKPEMIVHLAEQLWFTAVFWPRQLRVRGIEGNYEDMRRTLWRHILPYLTPKGKEQLRDILNLDINHQTIRQS